MRCVRLKLNPSNGFNKPSLCFSTVSLATQPINQSQIRTAAVRPLSFNKNSLHAYANSFNRASLAF